jgi:hypothetical protein
MVGSSPFAGRHVRLSLKMQTFNCALATGIAVGNTSALGQKQTSRSEITMSALPPKADIAERNRHVRFVPKADSCSAAKSCFDGFCNVCFCPRAQLIPCLMHRDIRLNGGDSAAADPVPQTVHVDVDDRRREQCQQLRHQEAADDRITEWLSYF